MPGPVQSTIDDSYPAAAYQDNIVGRMKNQGRLGNSDSLNAPSGSLAGEAQSLVDPTINAAPATQSVDSVVNSVVLPINALLKVGRALTLEFWGTTGANANAKDIKIKIGATTLVLQTGSTANAQPYYAAVTLVKTATGNLSAVAILQGGTGVTANTVVNAAVAFTEGATLAVQMTLNNTAAAATPGTGQGAVGIFAN